MTGSDPQITPVRSSGPIPVPSAGATGQAGQAKAQCFYIRQDLLLGISVAVLGFKEVCQFQLASCANKAYA